MKVLFATANLGGLGHLITLKALALKLDNSRHKGTFLLASEFHELGKKFGLNILPFDYDFVKAQKTFMQEISAYSTFKPDVVVDDTAWSTYFSTRLSNIARVAIQRKGMFPGDVPRQQKKQFELAGAIFPDIINEAFRNSGLPLLTSYTDLFAAEMKIVPGIKSIEVLPEHIQNDPTYVFAGPLIIDDLFRDSGPAEEKQIGIEDMRDYKLVESFFNTNKNRFIVYLTLGTVAAPTKQVHEAVQYLLDNGAAIITNIIFNNLKKNQQELFFSANYLPMHFVCSNTDLMIHHCGSGTYQYQILHQLPGITFGTGFTDREDIALRLEELGVGCHVPAPSECSELGLDFLTLFKKKFEKLNAPTNPSYRSAKRKLAELKAETDQEMASFNFTSVLEQAVENLHSKKRQKR